MKHVWTILHGGALGDLALTLRLARDLPGVEPATALCLIARTMLTSLADARPVIECHSSETVGLSWLYGDDDSPPPTRLSNLIAGRRVLSALGDRDCVVHRRLACLGPRELHSFDPRPRPDATAHIVTQWRRALAAGGLRFAPDPPQQASQPPLRISARCITRGRERLAAALATDPAPRAVLIHPGSGGAGKCWPLERFLDLARALARRGETVVWLLGPVELERWPADRLAALRGEFPVVAPPSTDALLEVLAAARGLIANDSGPAHLAALIGTPAVVLFGPTSPDIWQPLGQDVRILRGDPRRGADWGIKPAAVLAAALGK